MEKDYTNLIIGYLQGTLDPEETTLFYDWVNSDPDNKKIFFEAKAIYDACLTANEPFDTDRSWQKLLAKKKQSRNIIHWRHVASYAAVALIAIALTSSLFTFVFNRQPEMVATQYIGGDGLEADVIVMPDSTKISLGSKTTFNYENNYGKKNRIIHLSGEAYFDVTHLKNIPFIVKVNGQEIEVLGTKFNVMAYPGDSLCITTLLEGSVRLTTDGKREKQILKPGQQMVYNRQKGSFKVNEVDAEQFISWTSGYYYFPTQKLETILQRLGHLYGATFEVHSQKLNNTVFNGTFYRGQSLKDIMDIINLSIPIKYEVKDHHVIISE